MKDNLEFCYFSERLFQQMQKLSSYTYICEFTGRYISLTFHLQFSLMNLLPNFIFWYCRCEMEFCGFI